MRCVSTEEPCGLTAEAPRDRPRAARQRGQLERSEPRGSGSERAAVLSKPLTCAASVAGRGLRIEDELVRAEGAQQGQRAPCRGPAHGTKKRGLPATEPKNVEEDEQQ